MHQGLLASRIGVAPGAITRIELFRVPLSYNTARALFACLDINPKWAATGKGTATGYVQLPSAAALRVPENALFSDVFYNYLARFFDEKTPDSKSEIVLRHQRAIVNSRVVKQWFRDVPDGLVGELEKAISKAWSDITANCPREDPRRVLQRRLWYEQFVETFEARAADAKASAGQNQSKESLDIWPGVSDNPPVSRKIRSLQELIGALRARTKLRGQKAALARSLEVTRQAVDQWLSGNAKPSAEITFKLLQWVEQQERQ